MSVGTLSGNILNLQKVTLGNTTVPDNFPGTYGTSTCFGDGTTSAFYIAPYTKMVTPTTSRLVLMSNSPPAFGNAVFVQYASAYTGTGTAPTILYAQRVAGTDSVGAAGDCIKVQFSAALPSGSSAFLGWWMPTTGDASPPPGCDIYQYQTIASPTSTFTS